MADEGDGNVTPLPIKFKNPLPEERTIMRAWEVKEAPGCTHLNATYLIGQSGDAEVTCGRCKGKLDPMWVLGQLATHDRRYAESQARYQEEQKRLAERKRTKCEHCAKMTRISHR